MTYNPGGLAIPLFLLLMLLEYLFLRLRGRDLHRYNDSVNSLSMGMLLLTSEALLKTLTFAVFIHVYNHYRLMDFAIASWVTWLTFFFVVDLCYYWFHRCAHQYNFLWGAHVGHHQSEEYNVTTALRQSAFQYGFSWVFYLPAALLGCPPEVFLGQFAILKMYQFWLHTQAIHRIPLIEGIFSTPSSHRVHHAKNPIYIDRNYGGTLVIWDRLFGSWQPELSSEPCHYGTTRPLDTLNPIKANLQHWSMLAKDTLQTKHWADKFKLWFKPTGWRPQDCRETDHKLQHDGTSDRAKYDPQTTTWAKIYAGVSILSLAALAVMFLFNSPLLTHSQLFAGVVSVVLGVTLLNEALENKFRWLLLELVRLPVFLWLFWQLATAPITTQIKQSIVIEQSAEVLFEYVTQPNLWHEWHPQSLSVEPQLGHSFGQGQTFDEVIQTQFGKDHMSWQVLEHEAGVKWLASAFNHTKGTDILLRYDLKDLGHGRHEFTRTLDYDVPNFIYHVANELYFKQYMEEKSMVALQGLAFKGASLTKQVSGLGNTGH